jgi:hypothetical protein
MRTSFLSYHELAVDTRCCFVRRVEVVICKESKVYGERAHSQCPVPQSAKEWDDVQIMQEVVSQSGIFESAWLCAYE